MKHKSDIIAELIEFTECQGVIYKITNLKGRIYIGQTVSFQKRLEAYIRADKKLEKQRKIYNSIKKYGWDNHTFEIIECCEENELNTKERYYQEFFNSVENGLNCRYTQTNDKSGRLSQETKDKLSKVMKGKFDGENNPMYGKDWRVGKTQEELDQHKINVSNAQKGKNTGESNPMYGMKGSLNPFYGKKHSKETREIMSRKKIEYCKNNVMSSGKIVINLETGIFYESARVASEAHCMVASSLRAKLNGSIKNNTSLIYC